MGLWVSFEIVETKPLWHLETFLLQYLVLLHSWSREKTLPVSTAFLKIGSLSFPLNGYLGILPFLGLSGCAVVDNHAYVGYWLPFTSLLYGILIGVPGHPSLSSCFYMGIQKGSKTMAMLFCSRKPGVPLCLSFFAFRILTFYIHPHPQTDFRGRVKCDLSSFGYL